MSSRDVSLTVTPTEGVFVDSAYQFEDVSDVEANPDCVDGLCTVGNSNYGSVSLQNCGNSSYDDNLPGTATIDSSSAIAHQAVPSAEGVDFDNEDEDAVYHLLCDENGDQAPYTETEDPAGEVDYADQQPTYVEAEDEEASWDDRNQETNDSSAADVEYSETAENSSQELSSGQLLPGDAEELEADEDEEFNGSGEEGDYESLDDEGSVDDDQEVGEGYDDLSDEEDEDAEISEPTDNIVVEDESQFDSVDLVTEDNVVHVTDSLGCLADPADNAGPTTTQGRKAKGKNKLKRKKKSDKDAGTDGPLPKKRRKKRKRKQETGEKSSEPKVRKSLFERRNIRKIIEDRGLDEATKAAQKEEMERRQRLLEIQEQLRQQAVDLRVARDQEIIAKLKTEPDDNKLGESFEPDFSASCNKPSMMNYNLLPHFPTTSYVTHDGPMNFSAGQFPFAPFVPSSTVRRAVYEPEVVEISSSSDDDDNDLMVLPSDHEASSGCDEADQQTSGSHVNDAMNQADAFGRVLVNVGHPPSEPDIFLAPQLATAIKPHQIGGVRFLYDNLVESLDRYKSNNGLGCILAHSMGLGKTLQAISFVDVFLRYTGARSVLIIVPVNTLQNWVSEFNAWLPVGFPSGSSSQSVVDGDMSVDKDSVLSPWQRSFKLHIVNETMKNNTARASAVVEWQKSGGVLLVGYEMYRLLTSKNIVVKPRRSAKKNWQNPSATVVIDVEEEDSNRELLKDLQEALIRPGPDLVICDEGHRIKNCHASISRALKNIRTRRRVVLTGYPLQNNLMEYWCMVDFVRPNYLGTKNEFSNMFERPIMNGQCLDSTIEDIRLMRFRSHVLHKLLEGFVQRRGHLVLQTTLPEKEEHVILVRMSAIQRRLYSEFMSQLKASGIGGSWTHSNNPIKAFSVCCKIWNHPDILYEVVEQRKDDSDLDLDDPKVGDAGSVAGSTCSFDSGSVDGRTTPRKGRGRGSKFKAINLGSMSDDPFGKRDSVISYDWATGLMADYMSGVLEHSGKMVILMDIISQSVALSEKILVFSQSLFTLNLIEDYLSRQAVPNTGVGWAKNKNYFRLDGSTGSMERERLINLFNSDDNNKIHLFLLSTRAGCLGINLVGASRVVIFDASWNPCHDCQAVCRVYRYGQSRRCFIYRLVSDNTMEKKIYNRQISKQGISDRIVDEMNPQNLLERKQIDVLMQYEDVDMPSIDPTGCEAMFSDHILVNVVKSHHRWITKMPFTHESLLFDHKDQKLTNYEKRLAQQGYERDKLMNGRPSHRSHSPPHSSYGGLRPNPSSFSNGFVDRPVASVRPIMSTPSTPEPLQRPRDFPPFDFPRQLELKPGVFVRQIQTTSDIILPSSSASWDATPNKIPAGEKILVIKTPKGVYVRTKHGKVFAVHSNNTIGRNSATHGANSSPNLFMSSSAANFGPMLSSDATFSSPFMTSRSATNPPDAWNDRSPVTLNHQSSYPYSMSSKDPYLTSRYSQQTSLESVNSGFDGSLNRPSFPFGDSSTLQFNSSYGNNNAASFTAGNRDDATGVSFQSGNADFIPSTSVVNGNSGIDVDDQLNSINELLSDGLEFINVSGSSGQDDYGGDSPLSLPLNDNSGLAGLIAQPVSNEASGLFFYSAFTPKNVPTTLAASTSSAWVGQSASTSHINVPPNHSAEKDLDQVIDFPDLNASVSDVTGGDLERYFNSSAMRNDWEDIFDI